MNASATQRRTSLDELARCAILAGLAFFVLVGLLLSVRRFMRPNVGSLDPVAMLMLVAVGVSLAALVRMLWFNLSVAGAPLIERWLIMLLPTVGLILFGFALSTTGTSALAIVFAWLAIAGEEAFMLWRTRHWLPRARIAPPRESSVSQPSSSHTTQSIIRSMTSDGIETVRGTLRAQFQPEERTVYVHVGFCPPLPRLPTIEFEQTEGPEVAIKLAQALPHGARFDVRLKRASSAAANVEFAFHATAPPTTKVS